MVASQTSADCIVIGSALDVRNVSRVRAALHAALDAGTGDLAVDMHDVDGIDAAGLGMLAAAHLRAERVGRRLVLRNCSSDMRRVFAVTRLSRILNIDRSDGRLEVIA